MRLAAFTDYGLRVLMRLADQPDQVLTTSGLARELKIPYNHLTKIVQDLAKGGFLATSRGSGGGIRRARPPAEITLGEIVRYLEQRHAMVECFRADGGDCVLAPNCHIRPRLRAAREAFIAELDRTSLAECALPAPAAAEKAGGAPAAAPPAR